MSRQDQQKPADARKRQPRRSYACGPCKTHKIRCDHGSPCSSCVRYCREDACRESPATAPSRTLNKVLKAPRQPTTIKARPLALAIKPTPPLQKPPPILASSPVTSSIPQTLLSKPALIPSGGATTPGGTTQAVASFTIAPRESSVPEPHVFKPSSGDGAQQASVKSSYDTKCLQTPDLLIADLRAKLATYEAIGKSLNLDLDVDTLSLTPKDFSGSKSITENPVYRQLGISPFSSANHITLLLRLLPPRPQCRLYVQYYLEYVDYIYHPLHNITFLKEFDAFWDTKVQDVDPDWLAILFMILALAALHLPKSIAKSILDGSNSKGYPNNSGVKFENDSSHNFNSDRNGDTKSSASPTEDSNTDISKSSSIWFKASRRALSIINLKRDPPSNSLGDDFTDDDSFIIASHCEKKPTLQALQAFSLAQLYLYATNQIDFLNIMLAIAIRQAQSLGLHMDAKGKNELETELRRRIWWDIAGCDTFQALCLGRPTMIRSYDSIVPFPKNCHEEDMLVGQVDYKDEAENENDQKVDEIINRPEDEPTVMSFQIFRHKCMKILNKLCPDVNNTQPKYELVMEIDEEFCAYIRDLPWFFKPRNPPSIALYPSSGCQETVADEVAREDPNIPENSSSNDDSRYTELLSRMPYLGFQHHMLHTCNCMHRVRIHQPFLHPPICYSWSACFSAVKSMFSVYRNLKHVVGGVNGNMYFIPQIHQSFSAAVAQGMFLLVEKPGLRNAKKSEDCGSAFKPQRKVGGNDDNRMILTTPVDSLPEDFDDISSDIDMFIDDLSSLLDSFFVDIPILTTGINALKHIREAVRGTVCEDDVLQKMIQEDFFLNFDIGDGNLLDPHYFMSLKSSFPITELPQKSEDHEEEHSSAELTTILTFNSTDTAGDSVQPTASDSFSDLSGSNTNYLPSSASVTGNMLSPSSITNFSPISSGIPTDSASSVSSSSVNYSSNGDSISPVVSTRYSISQPGKIVNKVFSVFGGRQNTEKYLSRCSIGFLVNDCTEGPEPESNSDIDKDNSKEPEENKAQINAGVESGTTLETDSKNRYQSSPDDFPLTNSYSSPSIPQTQNFQSGSSSHLSRRRQDEFDYSDELFGVGSGDFTRNSHIPSLLYPSTLNDRVDSKMSTSNNTSNIASGSINESNMVDVEMSNLSEIQSMFSMASNVDNGEQQTGTALTDDDGINKMLSMPSNSISEISRPYQNLPSLKKNENLSQYDYQKNPQQQQQFQNIPHMFSSSEAPQQWK